MRYVATLITDDTEVVLILKKRPERLAGKWNGVGGKIEPGEKEHVAAIREIKEETGLRPKSGDELTLLGRALWSNGDEVWWYKFKTDYIGGRVSTQEDEDVGIFSLTWVYNQLLANDHLCPGLVVWLQFLEWPLYQTVDVHFIAPDDWPSNHDEYVGTPSMKEREDASQHDHG